MNQKELETEAKIEAKMLKNRRLVQAVIHVLINNCCTIGEAKEILSFASYVVDKGEQPLSLEILNGFND